MRAQAARFCGAGFFQFREMYMLAIEYQLISISFQAINTQPELQTSGSAEVHRLLTLSGSMKQVSDPFLVPN